jgi:hypothetical protein
VARGGGKWQTPANSVMNRVFHTGQGVSEWLRKFWLIRDNSASWNWLFVLLFSSLLVIYPATITKSLWTEDN